ncbi:uncharacterized protein LOC110710499 isoform X2 [Chenopodium quinoa]|uniref:Uncharacterized protein n=2 Tax=Chenopodium quinoa TaxID=63459 RepID=A0A803MJ95_CHEQI|nr:uncharacterized protein LOC110710499 isoform X2 [Chenopodium quinoa]XP_021744506.1 uncharacterized protein LOC110710499 isoform X2 [Chenopodium quinoa]
MSGGDVRGPSGEELQWVKNLIERCILLYMSKKEAVATITREANVMPTVIEILWNRLEAENQEFFEAYHIRLALKDQIHRFNELLKRQGELMGKIKSSGVAPMPATNGAHMAQFQQNAGCYDTVDQTGPSLTPESLQPHIAPSLPNSFTNGVSSLQIPSPFPSRTIDYQPNSLHIQNSSSLRLMQGLNGGIVKSESSYPSNSSIFYEADPHLGEAHGSMEDPSIAAFGGLEASSQPLNETLLSINGSFEQLGPKYYGLPNLVYPNGLENYTNSALMSTETENILAARDTGELAEGNKGPLTQNYHTYEDFGSE